MCGCLSTDMCHGYTESREEARSIPPRTRPTDGSPPRACLLPPPHAHGKHTRPQWSWNEDQVTRAMSRGRREAKARMLRAQSRKGSGNIDIDSQSFRHSANV
eukprot:6198801-Pleurochrysis_carterae.AAC.1